jgi:hypothetical protein
MFCEFFVQLPEEINEKMEDLWISVKASDGSTETVTVGGDHTAFWIILGLIVLICAFLNIWIRVRKHQAA